MADKGLSCQLCEVFIQRNRQMKFSYMSVNVIALDKTASGTVLS